MVAEHPWLQAGDELTVYVKRGQAAENAAIEATPLSERALPESS